MSTRSAILRTLPDQEGPPFGRYHHSDGYPSGVGKALFHLLRGHFKGDIGAMLKTLIDDHTGGWSNIVDADFTLKPGWDNKRFDIKRKPDGSYDWDKHRASAAYRRPACYCHGARHNGPHDLTLETAAGSGCEYAYVISPETRTMYVLSSYREDGTKMIGFFGMGDADADWRLLATVDLDGPEPNWDKVEGRDDE